MAITYNTTTVSAGYIYTATSGGTVFSANKAGSTAFDYFPNTAVTNDAIYFGKTTSIQQCWADILLNVGTALAGTGVTGVWEYPSGASTWATIPRLKDDTNGLTTTGANRVRFGFPKNWKAVAVNSITTTWVRFRITGGTISEGGANATDIPQIGNGRVNVTGYTTGSPCTLALIYAYMNTNYSYVGAFNNSNYYDFRWFSVSFDSPTVSYNEVLEIGFDVGGNNNVRNNWNFDYWTTGRPVGTGHGKQGSKIIINHITNSYPLTWTVNQKSYGASYFSNPNYNAGYPILTGTFYDCLLQISPGNFGNNTDFQNCTFEVGYGFIMSAFGTGITLNNNKFIITGTAAFSMYTASFSIQSPDIIFDTGVKYLVQSQQNNNSGIVWDFIDPVTALPSITDSNKPMYNTRGTSSDIANVFYYDDSAGTYTDITTQCSSATTGDVPIGGDVGDCLYFRLFTVSTDLYHPYITSTLGGTNDYVYTWEYYNSGWKTFTNMWDESNNFVQSGGIWLERRIGDISSTTINGVSGYWYRLRIVTKGTGSPMIDQIRRRYRGGTSDWKINNKNTINYTAKDGIGALLDGVNCTYTDKFGTAQFSGTTSSGVITPATVITKQWYFDPLDATRDTTNDTAEKLYNPFIKRARKYGYIFSDTSVTVAGVQNPVDVFAVNSYVSATQATAHAYSGISVDGATNLITITGDHTMQEVYDYCEDWATLNMAYAEPYNTSDGKTFISTFDLVLDGCALTGAGTISMVVNTVTYLNGATSTLDIVAVDGTHTNTKLTGLTANSRVQLYDEDSSTELYNEIVSATTLTFPIIWTADKSIRIRVSYVYGATAKKWYETTATLTNTGINLAINQEDDTVYNRNLVDGSTVDECSIVGTVLVVNVDDPDNKTTAQRIYAYEVYWLSTEDGIRDQNLYIDATDQTHYILEGGLKIKNLDMVNPLNITGANLEPLTGSATDILDTSGGMILINPETVVPFAYNVNGATEQEILDLQSQVRIVDKKVDDTQTRVITLTE